MKLLTIATAALLLATQGFAAAPAHSDKVAVKPQSLVGSWKGTFRRTNADGTTASTEYTINVLPDLKVEVLQSAGQAPQNDLQPTTNGLQVSATQSSTTLDWTSSAPGANGKLEITKHGTLTLEANGRNATFAYDIKVVNSSGAAVTTETLRGSGLMTRVKSR